MRCQSRKLAIEQDVAAVAGEHELGFLDFDGAEIGAGGGEAQGGAEEKVFHGGRRGAELVAPVALKGVELLAGHGFAEHAIRDDALAGVLNVAGGKEGGNAVVRVFHEFLAVGRTVGGRGGGAFGRGGMIVLEPLGFAETEEVDVKADFHRLGNAAALKFGGGGLEHLAIQVKADGGDVTGLLGAEEVAGAADFEVAHGDFEAGAECRVLFDGVDAFAGVAAGHEVARDHEVGVGAFAAATNATAQLVEVGEAEAVGAVDDNGVGVGDVDAGFDDGGADQDVGFGVDEFLHDAFEDFGLHLAVTVEDACFGAELLQFGLHVLDAGDAVVQEKDLPAAVDFVIDGFANDAFVVTADGGVDGSAIGRWGVEGGHVPGTEQGEIEGAGDGGGAEGQNVDEAKQLLEFFLMFDAEALFFVDNGEAEIFELDVFGDDPMGADDDIDVPGFEGSDGFPDFFGRGETAEHFDSHGVVGHPLAEGLPMLLGEDGGGDEDGDLFAAHDGFEGGANGDLGFAKADIAAEESVHGLFEFHVAFDFLDGADLVGRFAVDEGLLELDLPLGVGSVGVAFEGLAFGGDGEHSRGEFLDGTFGLGAGFVPAGVAEFVEFGGVAADADVAGDEMSLGRRDEEFGLVGITNDDDLFGRRAGADFDAVVFADAVVGVNDEVAGFEFAQVIAGLAKDESFVEFGTLETAMMLVATEDFGTGENGEFGSGDGEAAMEEGEGTVDVLLVEPGRSDEFFETFAFGFVVEVDGDLPAVAVPVGDLLDEAVAAVLLKHEVTGVEGAEGAFVDGEGVVFLGGGALGRAGDGNAECGMRKWELAEVFEVDLVIVGMEEIGKGNGGGFGNGEQEGVALMPTDGGLRVDVEGADGFDVVAEDFESEWFFSLPGKDVDDVATTGELAAFGNDGDAFVTGGVELSK